MRLKMEDTLCKQEFEVKASTSQQIEENEKLPTIKEKPEVKYFNCATCGLKERYDYFGNEPPFVRQYRLLENAYIIEDPFVPPKQGEIIILGTHCIKCGKTVCKDSNCSFYYDGSHCIDCAKTICKTFPENIQQKLNKIIPL